MPRVHASSNFISNSICTVLQAACTMIPDSLAWSMGCTGRLVFARRDFGTNSPRLLKAGGFGVKMAAPNEAEVDPST